MFDILLLILGVLVVLFLVLVGGTVFVYALAYNFVFRLLEPFLVTYYRCRKKFLEELALGPGDLSRDRPSVH